MYEIVYLPLARQDLIGIVTYIADQLYAPQAAQDHLDVLDEAIRHLEEFPYSHRIYRPIRPLHDEYRAFTVKNYLVFYVVREEEKKVEIQRVIYRKMDITRLL